MFLASNDQILEEEKITRNKPNSQALPTKEEETQSGKNQKTPLP